MSSSAVMLQQKPHASSSMNARLITSLLLSLIFGGLSQAAELKVSAAASLSDALKALAPAYEQKTGDKLIFNFGASGTLARQIKEGAPADVFLSADELRVDQLEKAGLLLDGTRQVLLLNSLVIVVPADSRWTLGALSELPGLKLTHIAIGEPATVPVGTYTKEVLKKAGLLEALSPSFIPLDNVRAVLAAVESGNADLGFVYRTDALISKKVRIALEVPASIAPRIAYPVAVLKASTVPAEAKVFAQFLKSPEASAVFLKYGFQIP